MRVLGGEALLDLATVGATTKDLGNGKTELTVTEYGYTTDEAASLSKAGLEQCLDKMAESLK